MSSPTRLDAIVTRNSTLRQLFRQAAAHRKFDLIVKRLLEEPLSGHIQFAIIRENTLILTADSPAWAAKLRYQVPELHRQIAENPAFPVIQTIRVKVAKSDTSRQLENFVPIRPLTEATTRELSRQAESQKDPALREALLRLADRRKR